MTYFVHHHDLGFGEHLVAYCPGYDPMRLPYWGCNESILMLGLTAESDI